MARPFPNSWTTDFYQGEEWPEWEITPKDKNGDDVTSYAVELVVFRGQNSTTPELVLTPGNGLVQTGATTYVKTKVLKADGSQFTPGTYVVEWRITDNSGNVYKMQRKTIVINKSLTNA